MADATPSKPKQTPDKGAGNAAAPKAKKAKPPKLEDKPFDEFIQKHFMPQAESALKGEGLDDISLSFQQKPLEVVGVPSGEPCWQVVGNWDNGQRQFNIGFLDEDIKGQKVFSYSDSGAKPSTIEQFMGDERRITLDLLVLYTVQRLNGQKWLTRN